MPRSFPEAIGSNLRRARERAGLTQEQLAHLARIEAASVSRYENGHFVPRMRTLDRLAAALKVRAEELLAAESRRSGSAETLRSDQRGLLKDYERLTPELRRIARRIVGELGRVIEQRK